MNSLKTFDKANDEKNLRLASEEKCAVWYFKRVLLKYLSKNYVERRIVENINFKKFYFDQRVDFLQVKVPD